MRKAAWDGARSVERPGGDGSPFLFSGTLVVRGRATARVHAVGPATEMGRIGKSLAALPIEDTALHRETKRLTRVLGAAALAVCALVAVLYARQRGAWTEGILAGLTLAISMIPEEFPVVLTIFLALGAWRMSRHRVLARRAHAIEALGSATVLCVDKTGTLTQNRMAVRALWALAGSCDLEGGSAAPASGACREALRAAASACPPRSADPMERALREFSAEAGVPPLPAARLLREYPIKPSWLAVAYAWRGEEGRAEVAVKGAPEAVLARCALGEAERAAALDEAVALAGRGLRVLAAASASVRASALPARAEDLPLSFAGLVAFEDPLRPTVRRAVEECRRAGIRLVMITGDHPGTALAIARQAGIGASMECLTGPEVAAMDADELARRIPAVGVFARILPEQTLAIVSAFKARGELVAMTGDGVNDAPALKAAHIGVAMGARGTDVAREAAGLVLLDDDFASLVEAVRMGRLIFDNLRKAMSFVLTVHIPIAGLALVPVLGGWPLLLLPVHILFLEMIIDPACTLVFEADPAEKGLMERPPRDPREPILTARVWALSLLQGASLLAVVLGVLVAESLDSGPEAARTAAFACLVLSDLSLILAGLAWDRPLREVLREPNPSLWWVMAGTAGVLALSVYHPFLRGLFRFSALGPREALLCVATAAGVFAWLELLKRVVGTTAFLPRKP